MPVDTNIILQQAIAAHQLSDLNQAENLYLSILKTDAQHPDANHNLGLLYISVEQPTDALPLLRRALEGHPQIEQFWVTYFEALSSAGKSSDARAILEAGKKNNLQAEIVARLETVLIRAEAGDDMYHPTPRNDPPELRLKHLAQLYESGLHQKMIDAAQQLLENFPKSALLHNMMGTASLALRQYDLARKSYETAIALDPDYILPHVNLGVTLSLMGHFNEAITHYQAGLKIDPNDINSMIYIGNALQSKGEYDTAIESYSKAIALVPDCAEAHNNLGNAFENQGNLQAAVKSYMQALVYQPENEATQNNLIRARQQFGVTDSTKDWTDRP